jgi:hypothetical protein
MDGAILYLQYIRPLDRTLYGLQGYFFQGVIQTNKQKTRRQDVRYKAKHGAKKTVQIAAKCRCVQGKFLHIKKKKVVK